MWSVDGSDVRTLRAGALVAVSPSSRLVTDVHLPPYFRGDGGGRHVPLPFPPVSPPVRHLGCERTCGDQRVGAWTHRLGVGAAEDERGVRGHRSRMSILVATKNRNRFVSRPFWISTRALNASLNIVQGALSDLAPFLASAPPLPPSCPLPYVMTTTRATQDGLLGIFSVESHE